MELYENFSDNNPFICVRLLTTSNGYVTKEIHCSHGNSCVIQTVAHLIVLLPRQQHHSLTVMALITVCLVSGLKNELE